jgi:hypothetical protein
MAVPKKPWPKATTVRESIGETVKGLEFTLFAKGQTRTTLLTSREVTLS